MREKVKTRLRMGDLVEVIAGKDRGKRGKITRLLGKSNRVVVEGIQMISRHLKTSQQNPQGGIQQKEASIHLSNVMIVDPKTDRPSRISVKVSEGADGKKKTVRIAKASGQAIDTN